MQYGLSIRCYDGIVLCANLKTQQSKRYQCEDNIRMSRFIWPDNRFIALITIGHNDVIDALNLQLNKDLSNAADENLLSMQSMQEVANYIGKLSNYIQSTHLQVNHQQYTITRHLLVGQIGAQTMETMLIYDAGNAINESDYAPFLQIGEFKYGKPILDKVVKKDISLNLATQCALVSMHSTKIVTQNTHDAVEILVYKNDSLKLEYHKVVFPQESYLQQFEDQWNYGLNIAFDALPNFNFE